MKHLRKFQLVLITTVILVACAGISSAQIELRFTPPDTTIAPDDATRISVMLDDAVFFRTIELTVTYDPTYISTDVAGPGDLFDDPDLFVWTDFVEDVPGEWYGVAVIMGATDSLSGPGELYAWEVNSGPDEGTTPIEASLLWAIQKARHSGGAREGGFRGSDVILGQIADGASRARVGLLPEGRAPMREGTPIFDSRSSI